MRIVTDGGGCDDDSGGCASLVSGFFIIKSLVFNEKVSLVVLLFPNRFLFLVCSIKNRSIFVSFDFCQSIHEHLANLCGYILSR